MIRIVLDGIETEVAPRVADMVRELVEKQRSIMAPRMGTVTLHFGAGDGGITLDVSERFPKRRPHGPKEQPMCGAVEVT